MTPAGEREPGSFFRLSPSRLAAGWFALCVVVFALFAIPLWYTWRANYATQKTYVDASDLKALLDTFDREGAPGLAKAIDARLLRSPSEDEVVFLADASRSRVAGNLETWPSGIPEQAGLGPSMLAMQSSSRVIN